MAVDKEKLAASMNEGEHVRPSATLVPMITLEGNKGVFMRRNVGDEGYEKPEEIGQTFSGVIVGVRQSLSDYKPRAIKSTPEYTSAVDKVPLFEKKGKDAKAEKIDEGSSVGLKDRYPDLREQRWLYLLVNGEVVKFRIKGAGLKHWFKFIKDLSKKKLHTFDVRVKFDPLFEKNEEIGKEYYTPAITIEKTLDDDEIEMAIAPQIERLSQEFKSIAEYRSKKEAEGSAEVADAPALDDIPVINLDDEEKVEDEDVPF